MSHSPVWGDVSSVVRAAGATHRGYWRFPSLEGARLVCGVGSGIRVERMGCGSLHVRAGGCGCTPGVNASSRVHA